MTTKNEADFRRALQESMLRPGCDPYEESEINEICQENREWSEARKRLLIDSRMSKTSITFVSKTNQIDSFVDALPIPILGENPPSAPIVTTGDVFYQDQQVCTPSTTKTGVDAITLAALAPNTDSLFPGSIVTGGSIDAAVLTSLQLDRARAQISIVCPSIAGQGAGPTPTISVTNPSQASVNAAVDVLLRSVLGGKTIKAMTGAITVDTFYSKEHVAMLLNAKASWLSGSIENTLSISSTTEVTNVVIRLEQSYYDLSFEAPNKPSEFFSNHVSSADIRDALGPKAVMPAYVSTIRYGRLILIHATSSAEEKSLKDVLKIAIGGVITGVQVNLTAEQQTLIKQTSFSMAVLGDESGTSVVIGGLEAITHIHEVWEAGAKLKPGDSTYPISYKLCWIGRNPSTGTRHDPAVLGLTCTYQTTTRTPAQLIGFGVRFHTTTDEKDATSDVRAELYLGDTLVAQNSVDSPHHNQWDEQDYSPHDGDAQWGGRPSWFANSTFLKTVTSADLGQARLRVTKSTGDGWTFRPTACVWLQGGQQVIFLPWTGGETHLENDQQEAYFPG